MCGSLHCPSTFYFLLKKSEKGIVISHFFEGETKVKKIASEIKPPLTCRVVLLLNRKIILAWESKISLVPNCLVNCLLIVCVMNLVMDRKINFVFNSANILRLEWKLYVNQVFFYTDVWWLFYNWFSDRGTKHILFNSVNLWEALVFSVSAIIESLFEKKVWML